MGPFGLTGGPGSTHISFWVLGFLLGLLRWLVENSGVAGWQAAFGLQVSGLASDFGKPLEREVLGKERHGCSHLPWANLLSASQADSFCALMALGFDTAELCCG